MLSKNDKNKIVSRNNYNRRKAHCRATQAPGPAQKSPPHIGNKSILNGSVRNKQFKIKKIIQSGRVGKSSLDNLSRQMKYPILTFRMFNFNNINMFDI